MLDTKTTAKFTCCAAVALSIATLSAGQTTTQDTRKPGDLDRIRKVSSLIGTGVMNHSNTRIAVVRDVAFSREGPALYVLSAGAASRESASHTWPALRSTRNSP